jgi:hypothetical protein
VQLDIEQLAGHLIASGLPVVAASAHREGERRALDVTPLNAHRKITSGLRVGEVYLEGQTLIVLLQPQRAR